MNQTAFANKMSRNVIYKLRLTKFLSSQGIYRMCFKNAHRIVNLVVRVA